MKKCRQCSRKLRIGSFYIHPMMKDGHLNRCKKCIRKNVSIRYRKDINRSREKERERNKRRRTNPEYRKKCSQWSKNYRGKYPNRRKWNNIQESISKNKPNSCTRCGIICNPHGHHADYRKMRIVVWLCPPCHHWMHRKS